MGDPFLRSHACRIAFRPFATLVSAVGLLSLPAVARADFGFPPPSNLTTTEGILRGVIVTLAVELALVSAYCYWRRVPMQRCLIAGVLGNTLTLPMVWFCSVMGWFFLAFLGMIVFVIVELLAGLVESVLYKQIGGLPWRQALTLGLAVNLVTMVMGLVDQAIHFQTKPGRPGPPRVEYESSPATIPLSAAQPTTGTKCITLTHYRHNFSATHWADAFWPQPLAAETLTPLQSPRSV